MCIDHMLIRGVLQPTSCWRRQRVVEHLRSGRVRVHAGTLGRDRHVALAAFGGWIISHRSSDVAFTGDAWV